jgi:hypothetical protein
MIGILLINRGVYLKEILSKNEVTGADGSLSTIGRNFRINANFVNFVLIGRLKSTSIFLTLSKE